MNARSASRGWALLIAVGLQALIVLIFTRGFGLLSRPQADTSMTVALIPPAPQVREAAARLPLVHVHKMDPGIPPSVPVDIVVPAPPELPPIPSTVPLITRNESAGVTSGTDTGIGIISSPKPDYTLEDLIRGAEGTTDVAVLVNTDGRLAGIKILHSSGDEDLDKSVVSAMRKWRFTPATTNSTPIASWGRLQVNFGVTVHFQRSRDVPELSRKDANGEVARLNAVFKAWGEGSRLALLTPALSRLLNKSGPVRNVRFLGGAPTPPASLVASNAQALRMLDSSQLARWDTFEVTQQGTRSQWYCAVDGAGQIRAILVDGG